MYESKMALAVKSNGRVLREDKDTVYLPFGCEYSLLIKNLNSYRAIVKVWIDGTDATDGTSGLVISPNSSLDFERFIKNGNLNGGNKFKFIERTENISNHRGNKVDDGLIRVEFEFERPPAPITYPSYPWTHDTYRKSYLGNTVYGSSADGATLCSTGVSGGALRSMAAAAGRSASAGESVVAQNASVQNASFSDVGITVPGSESNQQFSTTSWFPTDGVKHTMVLRMLGEVEGQVVKAPIVVQQRKVDCPTCGKTNKMFSKFCSECGTGLVIV